MQKQEIIDLFLNQEQKGQYIELEQLLKSQKISKEEFNLKVSDLIDNLDSESLFKHEDLVISEIIEEQKTVIIANGDIASLEQGYQLKQEIGVDGIMIGREIFRNPFVFNSDYRMDENGILNQLTGEYFDKKQRLELLLLHLDLWESTWKGSKPFNVLKKYFKIYIQGFERVGQLRSSLMETNSVSETRQIILNELKNLN